MRKQNVAAALSCTEGGMTSPTFPKIILIGVGLAWLIWQQSLSVQGYKGRVEKLVKKTHLLIELGLKVKEFL